MIIFKFYLLIIIGGMFFDGQSNVLSERLRNLIFLQENEPAPVESNVLKIEKMPWVVDRKNSEQYNKLYTHRIKQIGKRIEPYVERNLKSISEVQGRLGGITLIGMVKRIQHKRKRAFDKDYKQYYKNKEKIYSEEDGLQLEDSTGRIYFQFQNGQLIVQERKILPSDLPYGIVVGLVGKHNEKRNVFMAQKVIWPEMPAQRCMKIENKAYERKILIMSEPSLEQVEKALCLVKDKLWNRFSFSQEIKGIVIIGCSDKLNAQNMTQLDNILVDMSEWVDIFMMPSRHELFPENPYHPILLKKSYKTIGLCSNPQTLTTDNNLSLLFMNGDNLQDLQKNCSYANEPVEALELMVNVGHLCPSSPFSLKQNMKQKDYLILQQLPNVIISGKSSKFQTKQYKNTLLITVPERNNILLSIEELSCLQLDLINL